MGERLNILVAEDDPSDVLLLKRALSKAGLQAPIHFVQNGEEVIDYLQGEKPFDDRAAYPLPNLLVLDLKMPRLNGFEVLEWLRRQAELRSRMLVVVFSSSFDPEDVSLAYTLGANSYLVKPHNSEEFITTVRRMEKYWQELNIPPAGPAGPQ